MGFTYNDAITLPTNKVDGGQPSVPHEWVATDANQVDSAALDLRNAVRTGDYHGLRDMSAALPTVSGAGEARFVSNAGRFIVSEGTRRYKRVTKEDAFYDIRDFGASPGPTHQTATTAAFNAIFAAISASYTPPSTVNGGRSATIYIPFIDEVDSGWYIGDVNPYMGNGGCTLRMIGDGPNGYGGNQGATLVFNGTSGGTMLDFVAINSSSFENLGFNLNNKALVGVKLRQFFNVPNLFQVASNGVDFVNCYFFQPLNDYNSILVQAGQDDVPGQTYQAADYHFQRCTFSGSSGTKQGWGFKAVVPGNTKQFYFNQCVFLYLYRGLEANSGAVSVRDCEGGNIGYDRDDQAAIIYTGGTSAVVHGGGMENGNPGYVAQFCISTEGTPVDLTGVYIAGTAGPRDYMVSNGGFLHMRGCNIQNSRAVANSIAWTPSETINLVGQIRTHDSGKYYVCVTPGITNSSGGPTGTGAGIADGSVVWDYGHATGGANEARIQSAVSQMPLGAGACIIENCGFPYNTTALTRVPVYDGSHNPTGAAIGPANTDFAKTVDLKNYARGNRTGLFGSSIFTSLPDFDGINAINQRDQMLNDNNAAGLTVIRNDNGVYAVTVPPSVFVAAGSGHARIAFAPQGYLFNEIFIDVTTLFSGSGVTGIKASLGTETGTDTDLVLAGAIDSTGIFGITAAQRGALWSEGRVLMPLHGGGSYIDLKCTVTGGSIANINAGSLTVYMKHHRLEL